MCLKASDDGPVFNQIAALYAVKRLLAKLYAPSSPNPQQRCGPVVNYALIMGPSLSRVSLPTSLSAVYSAVIAAF